MRSALKSALLSALVFPGIGHFSLKKPTQGVILSGIAIICLYFLFVTTVEITQQLSVKIQNGEIPMDVEIISDMVSQQLMENDQGINRPSLVLLICWLVAIVDSYRLGRRHDNDDEPSDKHA